VLRVVGLRSRLVAGTLHPVLLAKADTVPFAKAPYPRVGRSPINPLGLLLRRELGNDVGDGLNQVCLGDVEATYLRKSVMALHNSTSWAAVRFGGRLTRASACPSGVAPDGWTPPSSSSSLEPQS